MEHHQQLNPKKRMVREWSAQETAAMDKVKISFFLVQHLYLPSVSIPQMQCRFILSPFVFLAILDLPFCPLHASCMPLFLHLFF